jgi:hypothetical protein
MSANLIRFSQPELTDALIKLGRYGGEQSRVLPVQEALVVCRLISHQSGAEL